MPVPYGIQLLNIQIVDNKLSRRTDLKEIELESFSNIKQ